MQCELSAETRDVAVSLVYRAWAEAHSNLKKVKAQRNDGSTDWALFHDSRLKHAIEQEAKMKRALDEIQPYSPIIAGK